MILDTEMLDKIDRACISNNNHGTGSISTSGSFSSNNMSNSGLGSGSASSSGNYSTPISPRYESDPTIHFQVSIRFSNFLPS